MIADSGQSTSKASVGDAKTWQAVRGQLRQLTVAVETAWAKGKFDDAGWSQ